ncbi:valine--tRNA ligase [Candidatus Palauibacter sp.]|uniref:valine--tRNA ligase n=1 Tax=Candidatus Palauibacter sp. TaxID=3101350 RepID=UPI003B59AEAD
MGDSQPATELSSRYDPAGLEGPMYERWVDAGLFHAAPEDAERPYVIVIPPPNVTAALHMGHGLNNTLQDVLIRRRRMQGYDVLWVPGTDHAGIATQNVVERQLRGRNLTRFDLGREAFVDRVWEWVEEYGGRIIDQLRTIGCSCDWERTRFTLDEGLSNAVREVFVRLYEKDLVYRGRYIINWCPRCRTALSNEEAEHRDLDGKLFRIKYPLVAGGHVEVATTRPETMLGDTGLAVSPDDDRYCELVGREAELPLVGRRLPIVADDHVDPGFGSGVVKVTPAHDPNDFEIGRRHGLEAVDVMTDSGAMNDAVPEAYRGLDRFEARERVVADLDAGGWLVSAEDHPHAVGRCYRCDTIVEPRLSLQWFVRMKPLAAPGLAAYESGDLRFHPPRYGRVYRNWMENIRDWCISRQLWWGHRIPVWYCEAPDCGEMVVAMEDPDDCPACGGDVRQDEDVLDTWFSSWLWPFSTLGWPERTEDLRAFYPTATLVTAPEILFFWVARMIMAGFEFMGELPFSDVLLNGTVRDHLGRRMSKSLGNGIDPLEIVESYGADAMRFTLVRGSPLGTDIQLDYENLEAAFRPGRNFANKMWNAARFALPHARADASEGGSLSMALADRWIRSRLARLAREMDAAYEGFRLHEAAEIGHAFVWGDFCDWYLELSKRRLGGEGEKAGDAGRTMTLVMRGWLSLLHPIMPFVTEAIAGRLPDAAATDSLVTGPWPRYPDDWIDPEADEAIEALQEFIGTVRALRAEYGVAQGVRVPVRLTDPSPTLERSLAEEEGSAARLAGLSSIARVARVSTDTETAVVAGAHAVLRTGGEVIIPLEGVIDLTTERRRIGKEMERAVDLLARTRRKLENRGFLDNAPPEVIEREREKLVSLGDQRSRLEEKLRSLGSAL